MGGAESGGMKWDAVPASGPGESEMSEGLVKDGSWSFRFFCVFFYVCVYGFFLSSYFGQISDSQTQKAPEARRQGAQTRGGQRSESIRQAAATELITPRLFAVRFLCRRLQT